MFKKLEEIVQQTCHLFKKYGIKSVSMDDIARECGISKKTLYEHIKDKNDLVIKVLEFAESKDGSSKHSLDFDKSLNAVDSMYMVYKGALSFFEDFNLSMEYDLKKYYPKLYKKNLMKRRERLYEKMIQNMNQGIKEGFYRADLNPDIIAKLHILKIESLLQTDIFENDNYSVMQLFKEMFIYHFMGIATALGIEEFNTKIKDIKE